MHLHATVSIWQREDDGSYVAELSGYKLSLKWHREEPGKRRGFTWEAEREGEAPFKSALLHEEPELAMAEAEAYARKGEQPERAA